MGRVKFREGSGHSDLTHPFVGHAEVKFREESGHAKLTHPLWAMQGENLEKDVAIST